MSIETQKLAHTIRNKLYDNEKRTFMELADSLFLDNHPQARKFMKCVSFYFTKIDYEDDEMTRWMNHFINHLCVDPSAPFQ